MTPSPNIREALDDLQDRQDSLYIIACAINLYSECLRRRAGRVLYGPKDVESLFNMAKVLLDVQDPGAFAPPSRGEEPSEAEIEAIADPYTEIDRAVKLAAQSEPAKRRV